MKSVETGTPKAMDMGKYSKKNRKNPSEKCGIKRYKANARERNRMKDLNTAMDSLRKCLPLHQCFDDFNKSPACQKLTKIDTVRLAANYITALSESLHFNTKITFETLLLTLRNDLSQATSNALRHKLKLDDDLQVKLLFMPNEVQFINNNYESDNSNYASYITNHDCSSGYDYFN